MLGVQREASWGDEAAYSPLEPTIPLYILVELVVKKGYLPAAWMRIISRTPVPGTVQ
jgi:hypothetical protein